MLCEQKSEKEEQSSPSLHNFAEAFIGEQLAKAVQEVDNSQQFEFLSTDSLRSASSLCKTKFPLPLPNCTNENSSQFGIIQNKQSVLRMLTGAFLLWSITHLIRYSLLSAKSVTIKEAAAPTPFFRNSYALLQDYFDGEIEDMQILMSRAEFTIVMLYSPWDARSKAFRRPFRQIAAAFQKLKSVKFVAANCNYYRGICRRKYKLLSFPVIFALTPYGQPVVFNQALSSDRLFTWILNLLSPLHALRSSGDIHRQIGQSDFLIVGHFVLQYPKFPLPRPYNLFLNAAYKAADLRTQLTFGIILNWDLALEMEFTEAGQLQFHTFYANGTEMKAMATFDIDERTKTQDIIEWANQCIQQFGTRGVSEIELEDIEAPGKLQTLYQKFNSSKSTLMLFTNSIGLLNHSTISMIALKNLAKMFNFCPAELENTPADGHQSFKPTKLDRYFRELQKKCSLVKREEPQNAEKPKWKRSKTFSKEAAFKNTENKQWRHQMDCQFWQLIRKGHRHIFWEYSTTIDNQTNDEEEKQQFAWENATEDNKFANESTLGWLVGAGCHLNSTMGFAVMDKRFGQYFIRKWGGQQNSNNQISFYSDSVAIVSMSEERIYWMEAEQPVNLSTMGYFISNYTNGTLDWKPASERILVEEEDEEATDGQWHGFPISKLHKLSRQMFDAQIINSTNRTQDVIIFYGGGDWHGPSRTVIHFFHQAKHYFQGFEELIRFCYLDTSKNELTWEYNFERLPVVIFFPAGSNTRESHTFPMEMAMTVPNLMGFLLPRCQPKLRWRLAFSICQSSAECLANNLQQIGNAMRRVRQEIQTLFWIINGHQLRRRWARRSTITLIINNKDGLDNLKVQLKRRRLQLATLVRLFHIVGSLQNVTNFRMGAGAERWAAKEAEYLTFFLTQSEQILTN